MTQQKSKKKLVRERMEETGESYQTAHRVVSAGAPPEAFVPTPRYFLRYGKEAFELTSASFTIGRNTSSQLVIDDGQTSRRHASFFMADGAPHVEDHESRNGVWLKRGDVASRRVRGREKLIAGDQVSIGTQTFTIGENLEAKEITIVAPIEPTERRDGRVGSVIGGKYRLLEQVAVPAEDPLVVYRAENLQLGGQVDIKLLPRRAGEIALHEKARLLREGRVLQRLSHGQIPKAFETGETANHEPYLVLESLGPTLAARLAEGPVETRVAHAIMTELADILIHLEECGVVHRGIRPAAIHLSERGGRVHASLSSFGLAKVADGPPLLMFEGERLGFADWMSPEQARREDVDGRSDLYALGRVLEALRVDGKLAEIGARLRAKEPSERPASARVVLDYLTRSAPA